MVRMTTLLCRVPVIRFRKGGVGMPPPPAPSQAQPAVKSTPAAMQPAAPQAQQAAPMSTGSAISDVNLPLRYRRMPLTDEEIALINGGGIV